MAARSTILPDQPKSGCTKWARSLLRETLRQRRAARISQRVPYPVVLSVRCRHNAGEQTQRAATATPTVCSYVAAQVIDTKSGLALDGRQNHERREGDILAEERIPAPQTPAATTAVIIPFPQPQQQRKQHCRQGLFTTVTEASRAAGPAVVTAVGLSPEEYLIELLRERGYHRSSQPQLLRRSTRELGLDVPPTSRQVQDYESKPFLTDLVRRGDLDGLKRALDAGRRMDASNKFGESLVHVACRKGNLEVLRFLVENGGSLTCCDDLGRFPLHEVCWAVEPSFDIVRLFLEQRHVQQQRQQEQRPSQEVEGREALRARNEDLEHTLQRPGEASAELHESDITRAPAAASVPMAMEDEPDTVTAPSMSSQRPASTVSPSATNAAAAAKDSPCLLLVTDKRGCTPLRYAKKQVWPLWRAFLDQVADEYWPDMDFVRQQRQQQQQRNNSNNDSPAAGG